MAEKLYAVSMGQPAENFAILDRVRIVRIIYSLSIFSLVCIKTPYGDAPSLIRFSAFMVDERYIFVCPYVEPFRGYALPIDGGSAKFSPTNFVGVG